MAANLETHLTPPAAALTTIFTPSLPYCQTGVSRFLNGDCMPTNWNFYWYSDYGYYSPAICPLSYTSGCDRPSVGESYGPPLIGGETAIICCPIDYQCAAGWKSYCTSEINGTFVAASASFVGSSGADVLDGTSASAYAIEVRWQSSDLSVLETNPLEPGVTGTGTAAVTSGASAGSTASGAASTHTSSTTGNHGLSTGAKIGIGVCIPVILIAVLAVGIYLCLKHRRRARERSNIVEAEQSAYSRQAISEVAEQDYKPPPHYMVSDKSVPVEVATSLRPNDSQLSIHREFSRTPLPPVHSPLSKHSDTSELPQSSTGMEHGVYPAPVEVAARSPDSARHSAYLTPVEARVQSPTGLEYAGYVQPPPIDYPHSEMDGRGAQSPATGLEHYVAYHPQQASPGNAAQLPSPSSSLELNRLQEEQARLQERKQRLMMLQQIDEQEQMVRERMLRIQGNNSDYRNRGELPG